MQSSKSWIEISEGRLRENLRTLQRAAAAQGRDTAVLAVIKANAYGHGAQLCAGVLASAGASWLGATDAAEGAKVRNSLDKLGLPRSEQPRILVMCGPLPGDAQTLAEYQLTPVVWTPDQLRMLSGVGSAAAPSPVHIEIDTGMSRQGVVPGAELGALLESIHSRPSLRVEGVLTHFASAEISGSPLTAKQRERFEAALAQIATAGLTPSWIHAGNTSTIDEAGSLPWLHSLARQNGARSLVRSGLALYGYSLPLEGATGALHAELSPVLTWKSRVIALSDIAPGATIGYNATFTASRPMRVALLPVGYADGLRRELSGTDMQPGGWVIIRGQRAPIIGRVSMNLTSVDATMLGEIEVGEEAVLLGDGVTAEDHARLARTIPYEILCGMRGEGRLSP